MTDRKNEIEKDKERFNPLNLYHLSPEQAISAAMKADPQKVDERLKSEGIKKDKKK
jgi:hypothetical protein